MDMLVDWVVSCLIQVCTTAWLNQYIANQARATDLIHARPYLSPDISLPTKSKYSLRKK